jgi:putative hemolysin
MNRKAFLTLCLLTLVLLAASCRRAQSSPTSEANLPNPASVYCEQNGGKVEMRQDASGGVAGVCVFPDGSECDEWAYYRKECQPGDTLAKPVLTASPVLVESPIPRIEVAEDGCKIYRNEALGYSFHYPAGTKIIANDDPTKSISIVPENEADGWPSITISHPGDRDEFRPPQDADLLQWLTDHNLLGEQRAEDAQIAGTTAIHFRHARSPQSFADDRYYFARDGQLYLVLIGHTNDKEVWDLYDHFLESFRFE